ncbi:MAG: recombinase family protein [Oscillospiraceae bacterium]|nr:recombinase family protein [Oscillospiraceae bacterium]
MRFAVYSRKSICTGKGESVENQIEMCRQYIFSKYKSSTNADLTIYEDEGFSGKNIDRPRFQQMLRDIKQQKFDFIVCYRLDRISRSVSDFSALVEELNHLGISLICIKEEFDTSKPMGKAMMYIASVFAQLERETLAERVRDNMLMLARSGRWLGGTTPTGFTSEKISDVMIDGKTKTSCKLQWNPDEIRIVKLMFNKFLELRSLSGVGKYLMKQGIHSRTGNDYSLLGIKDILQNPVYCAADQDAWEYFASRGSELCFKKEECSKKHGLLSYNKRDYKKKRAPRQPIEHWIIAIGRHKGVVTGKQWAAAQCLLERNKPKSGAVKAHNDYSLLSGMIRCAKCGSRMFAKTRSNNHRLYDYICQRKLRGGTVICSCPNLNGLQADEAVCLRLLHIMHESPRIIPLLEQLKMDLHKQSQKSLPDEIDIQIAKCSREMNNLILTLSQSHASDAFVQHVNCRITELDAELSRLSAEKRRLKKTARPTGTLKFRPDETIYALGDLIEYWDKLTISERRTLLQLYIQGIEWDGATLRIWIYKG